MPLSSPLTVLSPRASTVAVRSGACRRRTPAVRAAGAARAARAARAVAVATALLLGACESVPFADIGPVLEDDTPLATAVDAALRANPSLIGASISVKSLDVDRVRLSGLIDRDSQRHEAERTALGVEGVRSVVNTLYERR